MGIETIIIPIYPDAEPSAEGSASIQWRTAVKRKMQLTKSLRGM